MYGVIAFLGWGMFGMCSLVLLAELIDMVTSARRRPLAAGEAMPGSFNLEPSESTLSRRYFPASRATTAGWGGLNRFD